MNEMLINILMLLQVSTGKEIYFDKHESLFFIKDNEIFKPLFGGVSQTLQIDSTLLIPLSEINFSEITFSENKMLMTGKRPRKDQEKTEKSPELNQQKTDISPEMFRKNIGKIPQILSFLPETDQPEILRLKKEIEQLAVVCLKNTNVLKTVKKSIIAPYESAVIAIKKENITKLYEIKKSLTATKGRQGSPDKTAETMERKKRIKRIIILSTVSGIIILSSIIYLKFSSTTLPARNQNVLTTELLESCLLEYEKTTIIKSDWRKDQIIKRLQNTTYLNENEIINKIDSINNLTKF